MKEWRERPNSRIDKSRKFPFGTHACTLTMGKPVSVKKRLSLLYQQHYAPDPNCQYEGEG